MLQLSHYDKPKSSNHKKTQANRGGISGKYNYNTVNAVIFARLNFRAERVKNIFAGF